MMPTARIRRQQRRTSLRPQQPRRRFRETPPAQLRVVTFNLQNGTPDCGWPDPDVGNIQRQKRPEKQLASAHLATGSLSGWRGLRQGWAKLFGPRFVEIRTENARDALRHTAKQLRQLNPDIVCLQEVDKGQRRSGYLHQAQLLANYLALPYWRLNGTFAGPVYAWHRRPLRSTLDSEAGYGLAMLSRWPVKSWHYKRLGRARHRLGWSSGNWPGFSRGLMRGIRSLPTAIQGLHLVFGQMRALQAARVLTPLGVLAIGNTHLETHRSVASGQLRRAWISVQDLESDSAVLVGDFNLGKSEAIRALRLLDPKDMPLEHETVASYPADQPRLHLDQLMCRGWKLNGAPRSVRLPISDHCAVVYDLVRVKNG